MKIFISCDIEGIGCVVRPEHSTIAGRDYLQSRRLMTAEVNAAIDGAFAAGATRVLVADGHNVGLNLLPEELDERVELIMGSPRPLSMMEGVQDGFDAVLFIGYHARPGTTDGVIAHNYHSRLREMRLNGVSIGELGLNAALAGLYGAPVALVSGDAATCQEAGNLLPWVETVCVKHGIGAYAARCLHPHICRKMIREGTIAALHNLDRMHPWRVEEPCQLEIELTTTSGADRIRKIPGFQQPEPLLLRSIPVSLRTAADMFYLAADEADQVAFI